MTNTSNTSHKRFTLGISLKLFIAFWLVIITSVLISYLITMQFKQLPLQEQATPQQLKILVKFSEKVNDKEKVKLKELQRNFYRKYQQDLIIKRINNNRIYLPRKPGWFEIRNYLEKNPLNNPVTIDFGFAKVTSSQPIMIDGKQYQFFIAKEIHRKHIINLIKQLPVAIRILLLFSISFLCCWLLAKSFSKPLIAIQKASKDIGEGKLTTRITEFDQRSDEFGDLARSFNQMAEQLESNISAHQRLLGDVSHELRSPLTRLQLAVAMAEKNIGNTEEQQKHLNRCELEVERLDEMIADVLTLSRLEHNKNTCVFEEVNLNKLVNKIVNDGQYFATSKQVEVIFIEKLNYTISADEKLLASAISNVVNNAIKYSPVEQQVIVELKEQSNTIMLSISDNGSGVPESMIDKLFQPFFRVADARDRSSGGTGLGLAIAQQAISLHHGSIVAKNQSSGGLLITITLPLST
ncbi:ATP-binding protein [Colwellia sp. E2M01]|uniref:ATP-binding protein n=1 Tax=Colwellia sp. E2M01 TaxID=2841561 RepID=UPI001C09CC80|nr:ATP-binding protein [Colwellia sp. E2M01]MBU2871538.1 HAMP domain-containing protein [Colwellia sp. E2M01]